MRQFVGGERKFWLEQRPSDCSWEDNSGEIAKDIQMDTAYTVVFLCGIWTALHEYEYKPLSSFPNSINDNVQTCLHITSDSLSQTS